MTEFTLRGISVGGDGVDASDPTAFPTFLRVNLLAESALITMTAIPEPGALALILIAVIARLGETRPRGRVSPRRESP